MGSACAEAHQPQRIDLGCEPRGLASGTKVNLILLDLQLRLLECNVHTVRIWRVLGPWLGPERRRLAKGTVTYRRRVERDLLVQRHDEAKER